MSTAQAIKARNHNTSPSTERSNNPFDTVFDGDDDNNSDEWWDEETVDSSTHKGRRFIRVSQWPKPPQTVGLGVTMKPASRTNTRRHTRTYSVQKPIREKSKGRQKKQNAKAGIKLVTDFSRHQPTRAPVHLQQSQSMPQAGRFVDMAALRALNGESNQSSGGFWRTKKDKALTRAPNTAPTLTKDSTTQPTSNPTRLSANRNSQTFLQSPSRATDDLSPNDRPIVIGISIPSSDISVHSVSPQTAASDTTTNFVQSYQRRTPVNHTPDTPTIIITPAQETSAWSPLGQSMSSDYQIYDSSSESSKHYTANDAPPVPRMPNPYLENERQRIAAQKSYFSPDSDDVTTWGDEDDAHFSPRSKRASSDTIFEDDDTPVTARAHTVSIFNGAKIDKHASISTVATRRRSKGWWNYITTPFLTRSNTFAARDGQPEPTPAVPDLAIAVAKAQAAERDGAKWEKQFSPLTPKTSTTAVSDQWWDLDAKKSEQSPVVRDTRHKVQTSTGTLPIVLSETAGFGTPSLVSNDTASNLSRETTSSSFGHTGEPDSGAREVPILADAPRTRSIRSNNPYVQPSLSNANEVVSQPVSRGIEGLARSAAAPVPALTPGQAFYSPSVGGPPPYSSPNQNQVKYKAILPPAQNLGVQYPVSPGPVSPGLQQAMSSGGAIPMSEVPLSPPARRPINLNSGYPVLPARNVEIPASGEHYGLPPTKASKKAESKRRRHEKEEVVAHRVGGFWRGRGCVPSSGCYGRKGAEGRKRRRWYLCLIIFFLALIILIIVLATTLHRKSNTVTQPSQWLNLTGFPPIFLGLSTVVAPVNVETNTGCVFPATQWSCDLPKELQSSVAPNQPDQPNFFLYLQWDNSSATNATFANVTGNKNLVTRAGNPVSAGQFMRHLLLKAREIVTIAPNPAPPTFAEEFFLGNTTDGIVSSNKAGEPTPFYISLLPSLNASTSSGKKRRDTSFEDRSVPEYDVLDERDTNPFPNLTQIIPGPSLNSDGTAAPANLLPSPLPFQQPIRLYDRGLSTEHYGFYTYFERSIFLKSLTNLNETNLQNGAAPDDLNGGATESEANFRCTWTETRFLVQMWTRMGSSTRLNNFTASSSSAAAELRQPGSFPYPITVTTDRHGGDPATKMLYCYSMNDREGIDASSAKLIGENRAFGGTPVNPAPTVFFNASTTTLGGFDGGTGGCACAWTNFQNVVA